MLNYQRRFTGKRSKVLTILWYLKIASNPHLIYKSSSNFSKMLNTQDSWFKFQMMIFQSNVKHINDHFNLTFHFSEPFQITKLHQISLSLQKVFSSILLWANFRATFYFEKCKKKVQRSHITYEDSQYTMVTLNSWMSYLSMTLR